MRFKPISFILASIIAIVMSAVPLSAQQPVPRSLSLETILACQNDALLERVFTLKASDVDKVNRGSVNRPNLKYDEQVVEGYGFSLVYVPEGQDWLVVSTKNDPQSFCRSSVTLSIFKKSGDEMYPETVSILGRYLEWGFDINEIFKHADQFKFQSGVYDDSTLVYFTASRGAVHIQFAFVNGTLRLAQVIYDNPRRFY
jgi:hypothetical protein